MSVLTPLTLLLPSRRQLYTLLACEPLGGEPSPYGERLTLDDRLGRAGLLTRSQRRQFLSSLVIGSSLLTLTAGLAGYFLGRPIVLVLLVLYGELWLITLYLNVRARRLESAILNELPLMLESLTLLVEAGVSLVSALDQLTPTESEGRRYILSLLHEARRESSAGVELSTALRGLAGLVPFSAARHVVFHLDLGLREGGSCARSLRALADYSHAEWQLAVTTRIRRLETLIVFPVFTAVLGLLMLISSGPLLTLLQSERPMFSQSQRFADE